MKAEAYYREKNYLVDKQLTSPDLENIAIMESFSRIHAIDFLNYCSCVEDFSDPNGLDKENIKIYDAWINSK